MRFSVGFTYILASAISLLALLLAAEKSAEASTNFCTNLYYSQPQTKRPMSALNELVSGVKKVLSPELNPEDYRFTGATLGVLDLQFLKINLSQHIEKLIRGDHLQVLQPEDIPPFITYSYAAMKLFVMDSAESSKMNEFMSEVYATKKPITKIYFKIHFEDGRQMHMPYNLQSISTEEGLLSAEAQFYTDMYKRFGNLKSISGIELVIYQPNYDVILRRPELLKVVRSINRINEDEVSVIEKWAQRLPSGKVIYVKKMVPNGYYYYWFTKTGLK